jgi:DNA-binding IclR family transcriptional regulator
MKSSRNGTGAKPYSVPAIHRTLDIVEALVHQKMVTVSELHRQFKIPKSSAYAILQTLKARGYVDKDGEDRYSLTLRLFTLGSELMENLDLHNATYSLLQELTKQAQLTGHIGVLDHNQVVYIEKIEVLTSVRLTTWLGRRICAHSSAMGKALLAFLPEEDVDAILGPGPLPRLTPKTITKPAQLKLELDRVRKIGYSVGDEQNELGIRSVGAPIFDRTGRPIAAVNLGASTLHMHTKDVPRLGALVRSYALKMSARLGYRAGKVIPAASR